MSEEKTTPNRYIGIDLHKHYLVATGVSPDGEQVCGPWRVQLANLEEWRKKHLTPRDAVAVEVTTNTFALYDELLPHVHSITVVHPPDVPAITRARVKTDRKAALILAQYLAKGMLTSIWVPPHDVRDLRATLAQRTKFTRLATIAKNRLHSVLHRHHLPLPAGSPFAPDNREWWLGLPVSSSERVLIETDLATLVFAEQQVERLTTALTAIAAQDERVPLLMQQIGFGLIVSLTLLAAIGDISRFEIDKQLVGYAGLGARVHDSGQTHQAGRITKEGRRDLRAVMIEAAWTAVTYHPHWKAEFARLEPRLGRNKAIVAIARKLLIAVWHILTDAQADRFAQPDLVARKLLNFAYMLGAEHRPDGQSAAAYARAQLDRLGIGADLSGVAWGKRSIPLPPSSL
jgi:transposase